MPLSEIRRATGLGIEIEVFAHGALCVSGSGQCLFSSMVGGRSANRGRCAQPCRLPYRLMGVEGHLLSCRDLCTLDRVGELIDAGVHSLKLEGRLKRPEYVCTVTSAYRAAIDDPSKPVDIEALAQMFNRGGFTAGYLDGAVEAELIYPARPNHIGVPVGKCLRNEHVTLEKDVGRGDSLVLRHGELDVPVSLEGEAGARAACPQALRGDRLIRLVSEAQMDAARAMASGERRVTALSADLALHTGHEAALTVSDGETSVTVRGERVERARTRGLDPARATAQIGKTGGTPWRFSSINTDIDEDAFLSMAALNALRRDAIDRLEARRSPKPHALGPVPGTGIHEQSFGRTDLLIESSDAYILNRARDLGADGVIYRPADLRAFDKDLPDSFMLRLPDMLPGDAQAALSRFAQANDNRITATFINNIGQFNARWPGRTIAAEGLNVANAHAVEQATAWGAQGYVPSLELSARQIKALPTPAALRVYGDVTLMHLRHCPYRTADGLKGRHADCSRCDLKAETEPMTDRKGVRFPLRRIAAPGGCVLELDNAVPLMLLRHLGKLPKAGAWIVRTDDRSLFEDVVALHRMALDGQDFRQDARWERFSALPSTTGHYFRPVE